MNSIQDRSQSLLHQVNDSHVQIARRNSHTLNLRRNPFYIRSMIHTSRLDKELIPIDILGRNPFYIRSMIHTNETARLRKKSVRVVAIPSTSGQWFTQKEVSRRLSTNIRSQSLLHQVNDSHVKKTTVQNAVKASQSLLHQVNDSHGSMSTPRTSSNIWCRNPFYIRSMIHTKGKKCRHLGT